MGTHRGIEPNVVAAPRMVAPPPPGRGSRLTDRIPVQSKRWQEDASCRGQSAEYGSVWLYPSKHTALVVEQARRTCTTCPVIVECRRSGIRVGIVAGRIWWDGAPAGRETWKGCDWCGTTIQVPKRFCCGSCKDRWHYDAKLKAGSLPAQPLLDLFDGQTISRIADTCGVSRRTVDRWYVEGRVPGPTIPRVLRRLGLDHHDIWKQEP